jgi:hypothetical protein
MKGWLLLANCDCVDVGWKVQVHKTAAFGDAKVFREPGRPLPPGLRNHNKHAHYPPRPVASTRSTRRDVKFLPSSSQLVLKTQHDALPKTPPALAPTSPTRAVDSKRGRPREPDADDSSSGTEHARARWLFRRNVSGVLGSSAAADSQVEVEDCLADRRV